MTQEMLNRMVATLEEAQEKIHKQSETEKERGNYECCVQYKELSLSLQISIVKALEIKGEVGLRPTESEPAEIDGTPATLDSPAL